ncbi:hypothetical protein predicted by Glimmer/Critica (plasmid) [Sinorhizobium fredii HH103]|uniref:Uncharacterized protein n=1 Tax=Sinorhizobium fredii (strain HH103) TaxID=1117943 RepID=G9AJ83_SINF1|nr:hypothetical protein predicted by Glimmer/Critica [Sinorhizobium fredii HH103]
MCKATSQIPMTGPAALPDRHMFGADIPIHVPSEKYAAYELKCRRYAETNKIVCNN